MRGPRGVAIFCTNDMRVAGKRPATPDKILR